MSSLFRHAARPTSRLSMIATRRYHATPISRLPYKDDQDKDSLKPRSTENVKTASDQDVAGLDKAAYKPGEAGPEEALNKAGQETDSSHNPLDASGANQELSKPRGDEKSNRDTGPGTEQSSTGRSSGSGGSSPGKGSKLKEHIHKKGEDLERL